MSTRDQWLDTASKYPPIGGHNSHLFSKQTKLCLAIIQHSSQTIATGIAWYKAGRTALTGCAYLILTLCVCLTRPFTWRLLPSFTCTISDFFHGQQKTNWLGLALHCLHCSGKFVNFALSTSKFTQLLRLDLASCERRGCSMALLLYASPLSDICMLWL